MRELALFAGAGGGLLASELLGWRTVCAVEINDYARSVLLARQRDRMLRPFPVWDDVRTFDAKPWRGVIDVVSGGFPCVDISVARAMWGRSGINGDKSGLWSEYLRIIDECQPQFVWGENSPALKDQGLSRIVRSLSERGYVSRWTTVGASDVGMRHARKRLWFVGSHPDRAGLERHSRHDRHAPRWQDKNRPASDAPILDCPFCGYHIGFDDAYGCPNCLGEGLASDGHWAEVQPRVTGMDHGVANRMDRLVAVGNGQVPAVAVRAWKMLTT